MSSKKREARRPISRVLCQTTSLLKERKSGDDYSSGTTVTGRLVQPTRAATGKTRCVLLTQNMPPLFGFAPGGVYRRHDRYRPCGALLPHPFTLTSRALRPAKRFAFCGTVPGVAPAGRYPAPCFLEPGLSSIHPLAGSKRQPSGHLACLKVGPPRGAVKRAC